MLHYDGILGLWFSKENHRQASKQKDMQREKLAGNKIKKNPVQLLPPPLASPCASSCQGLRSDPPQSSCSQSLHEASCGTCVSPSAYCFRPIPSSSPVERTNCGVVGNKNLSAASVKNGDGGSALLAQRAHERVVCQRKVAAPNKFLELDKLRSGEPNVEF